MPKKTKRQKLHADVTRARITAIQKDPSSALYFLPAETPSRVTAQTVVPLQKRASWSDYSAIRRDFVRISVFTFLAFLANGMLYFLTNQ